MNSQMLFLSLFLFFNNSLSQTKTYTLRQKYCKFLNFIFIIFLFLKSYPTQPKNF